MRFVVLRNYPTLTHGALTSSKQKLRFLVENSGEFLEVLDFFETPSIFGVVDFGAQCIEWNNFGFLGKLLVFSLPQIKNYPNR